MRGILSVKLTLPMLAVLLIGCGCVPDAAAASPAQADGREVQGFDFEPGAPVYLNLTYADGAVIASPYDSSIPMPTPYKLSTIAPEPQTEHTGIGLSGSWMFVMATMMSLVVVGCFATVRRKGR